MTQNKKKKRVDPQGYYVLKAIYQTAAVNNADLFLCGGNFSSLRFGVQVGQSTYFMPDISTWSS